MVMCGMYAIYMASVCAVMQYYATCYDWQHHVPCTHTHTHTHMHTGVC